LEGRWEWKGKAGLTITLQLKQQHFLQTFAAAVSSGVVSAEAEVDAVVALGKNF